MIGGAGYSFPKDYLRAYPQAEIDVVEIDPGITQIARDHFRVIDDPRMRIFHEDGRIFINAAPEAAYDAILMDAFGSLFSVPTHLTTVEAVREFDRILKPNGVLIVNVGGAIMGDASHFLQAQLATYESVFPKVEMFKVQSGSPDDKLQNLIIVASRSAKTIWHASGASTTVAEPNTELSSRMGSLLARRYDEKIVQKMAILTDDLAPVEYYNSAAQNHRLSAR
jgi:spermidine synthase